MDSFPCFQYSSGSPLCGKPRYVFRASLFEATVQRLVLGVGKGLARTLPWPLSYAATGYNFIVELMSYCVTEYYFYTAGS